MLLIFVDLFATDQNDPVKQIELLKNELSKYKEDLTQKVSWIVCNKIDLLQENEIEDAAQSIKEKLGIDRKDIFFISAATGEGTKEILQSLEEVIAKEREELT